MPKVTPNPKQQRRRTFIRAWRQHRGLTIEQLAERVGVTHGAISQLERGLVNYTQPMLEAIADALMCEPADLIMRDPTREDALWSIYDQLEPAQRNEAVDFMRYLRDRKAG